MPEATLKAPERWDRMFGRLLETGQTLDQVEAVMRFALVGGRAYGAKAGAG